MVTRVLLVFVSFLGISGGDAHALSFTSLSLLGVGNYSQLVMTPSGGSAVVTSVKPAYGGALLTEIAFGTGRMGVELGGMYYSRSYSDTVTGYTETRFEVPVLLRLHLGPFSLGAGAYAAKAMGEIQQTSGSSQSYEARGLKALDLGYAGAASMAIRLGPVWASALVIEGRYSKSLTNSSSASSATGAYTNIQVLAGIRFKL